MSPMMARCPRTPKVLVVDDNPNNLLVVRRVLAKQDLEIVEAQSGSAALRATLDDEFALILLDVYMPDINGFEVAEILSQEDSTRQTPIIFVTATYADDIHRLKGYRFGAVDYMAKPLEATILLSKVNVFLELYRNKIALRDALEELSERNRQLEKEVAHRRCMEEEMRHLATHDALTRLPNRTLFLDRLDSALARALRSNTRFALVYLDMDGFKEINDQWGHAAGDAVLIAMAQRLSNTLREQDTIARLGGDEFAVIIEDLPDFAEQAPQERLHHIHQALEAPLIHFHDGNPVQLPMRISIGLAVYPDDCRDIDALLHTADQAMYTHKRQRTGTPT